jgi:hypothetical protein
MAPGELMLNRLPAFAGVVLVVAQVAGCGSCVKEEAKPSDAAPAAADPARTLEESKHLPLRQFGKKTLVLPAFGDGGAIRPVEAADH